MSIWAIGDLHLSFGTPDKSMDPFGEEWVNHPKKIAAHWHSSITDKDLVLLPGDLSWAKTVDQAMPDLEWIASLPGTKVMIRGNHDSWWSSIKKVRQRLPSSLHAIQNDSFTWNDYIIGGARLWDCPEFNFGRYIPYVKNPTKEEDTPTERNPEETEKIYVRELHRLEMSLETMKESPLTRIVMTHYPPLSGDCQSSRVSALLEKYEISMCVFGHLHSINTAETLFGERNGIRYLLASADFINFKPIQVF